MKDLLLRFTYIEKGVELRNWGKYELCSSYFQLGSRFQTWWEENVGKKIQYQEKLVLDNTLNFHILRNNAEAVTGRLNSEGNQEADKN